MAMYPMQGGDPFAPFRQMTPAQLMQAAAQAFRPPSLPQVPGMSMPQQQMPSAGLGEGMGMLSQALAAHKKQPDKPGTITPGPVTPGTTVQPGQMVSTSAIDHAIAQQPQNANAMIPVGQPSGNFFEVLARLFR